MARTWLLAFVGLFLVRHLYPEERSD